MKKLIGMIMAIAMIFALATTAFAADPSTATSGSKVFVTTTPNEGETKFDTSNPNTIDIPITGDLDTSEADNPYDVTANYYVIVKYDVTSALKFKINEKAYTWNVNTEATTGSISAQHTMKSDLTKADGTWSGNATVKVTLENWSNRDMQAALSFAAQTTADPSKGVVDGMNVDAKALSYTADSANESKNTKWDNNVLTLRSAAADVKVADGAKAENPVKGIVNFKLDADAGKATEQVYVTGAINKAQATIGTLTVKLTALEGNTTFNSTTPSNP